MSLPGNLDTFIFSAAMYSRWFMSNEINIGIEEVREAILQGTKAGECPDVADKLIEEFARRVVDESNPAQALDWIRARAHELGHSGKFEDVREAVSTNYFTIGFLVGWLVAARFALIRLGRSSKKV
jgi:hypothetical protein